VGHSVAVDLDLAGQLNGDLEIPGGGFGNLKVESRQSCFVHTDDGLFAMLVVVPFLFVVMIIMLECVLVAFDAFFSFALGR
jgi:hypothetical protein